MIGGELVAEFFSVPPAPQRFELIRSGTADGISGDFSSVIVQNLPQGYTHSVGVVLDGVERDVLDLQGSPVKPVWLNTDSSTGGASWFDSGSWATPLVPGGGDEALINNGGRAVALAATAPGPMRGLSVTIG